MVKWAGVYRIHSLSRPERCYVGSARNIEKRWYQHRNQLLKAKHHSFLLQRHFNVHGMGDLRFHVIQPCPESELQYWEQSFIDILKPYFNISPSAGSQAGFRHSESAKQKMSAANIGHRRWVGRKHSPEAKAKMRDAKLGRKLSFQTRVKLSAARVGNKNASGNKNRLGIGFSEASRRQISESLRRYYANRKERSA